MESGDPGLERSTAKLALSFSYTGRMFVIGRGVEFATAREIALKLLETCRIAAEPLTATDLAHGPVAALDHLFPVWAIASQRRHVRHRPGSGDADREMGASLVASGTAAELIKGAAFTCRCRCRSRPSCPRSCPSFPGSSSRLRWRGPGASIPTRRTASPR